MDKTAPLGLTWRPPFDDRRETSVCCNIPTASGPKPCVTAIGGFHGLGAQARVTSRLSPTYLPTVRSWDGRGGSIVRHHLEGGCPADLIPPDCSHIERCGAVQPHPSTGMVRAARQRMQIRGWMKSSFFRGALPKIAGQARQTALLTKTRNGNVLATVGLLHSKGKMINKK